MAKHCLGELVFPVGCASKVLGCAQSPHNPHVFMLTCSKSTRTINKAHKHMFSIQSRGGKQPNKGLSVGYELLWVQVKKINGEQQLCLGK